MWQLAPGLTLIGLSIAVGSLFLVDSYHALFWRHPLVFGPFPTIGLLAAILGGRAACRSLANQRDAEVLRRGSIVLGIMTFVIGCAWVFVTCWAAAIENQHSSVMDWRHLQVIVPIVITGVLLAVGGAYYVYRSLPGNSGVPPSLSLTLGTFLALVNGLLGIGAVLLTIASMASYSHPMHPYSYSGYSGYRGDYMLWGIAIKASQLCIPFGIVGYALRGLGLRQPRLTR